MSSMNTLILGRMIISVVCFVLAGVVAYSGNDGWGWLIFAGIVMGGITLSNSKDGVEATTRID